MIDAALQNELLKQMEQLALPLQRKVVDFAHSLATTRPRGTPGDQLLKFAGTLSPEDAKAMLDAIEEECERIEPDEW